MEAAEAAADTAVGGPDAGAVDTDVVRAVGEVLERVLDERTAEAAAVHGVFARDLAGRVARFALLGGKRIRAQFLWWGLRACGGGHDRAQTAAALRVGAALELIQTCALVHDDVMDGSALRRGRPALHTDLAAQYPAARRPAGGEPFGRAAAVLAGDLAFAWADDTFAGAPLPRAVRDRTRLEWQAMRTEMVAGQYLDLQAQATGCRSAARALRTACLKSALYSVERPLALGAALAGADEAATRALRSAGRCAGLAFQLRDDLLGVFGDPQDTGKPAGEDVAGGKLTYLVAVAFARARASGDSRTPAVLEGALGSPDLDEGELARVRAALEETGARAVVEARIERLAELGVRHLDALCAEPAARRRLVGLLRAVTTTAPRPAAGPGLPEPPRADPAMDGAAR